MWCVPFWNIPLPMGRLRAKPKPARPSITTWMRWFRLVTGLIRHRQAIAEYEKFNKQQRIESDFDREVKRLLQKRDTEK